MKACTAAEVVEGIADGSTVALGGAGLQRKPMAMVRALAEAGRRDLRVVTLLGSVDLELLLAAACVAEIHTAGCALDGAGLAPRYRRAREDGFPPVVEWSEGTLLVALEAAARGVPSLPTWMGLGTDLPEVNRSLKAGADPFDETEVMMVRALSLDWALLHVSAVDDPGNAYTDGDLAADGALARAARRTVVSFERRMAADPSRVALSRLWVDRVAHLPGGAWPTGCHAAYGADAVALTRWVEEGAEAGVELLAPHPQETT